MFDQIFAALADPNCAADQVMMDSTYLKSPPHKSHQFDKEGGGLRLIGRTKGGLNSKLHVVS